MKYLTLPQPTVQERNRVYEIEFYLLLEELKKISPDIQNTLYALAQLTDVTATDLIIVSNRVYEPLNLPTKIELSVTLAYLNTPIREITEKYIHHKTYYKNTYSYFDEESTIPRLINRLSEEDDTIIIKVLAYIKKNFHAFDVARRGIIYG